MKKIAAKKIAKSRRYTASDLRAVGDNPRWTKEDFTKAKSFDEVFPAMRKGRGPNKEPTKRAVSIRLSPLVVDYFKSGGPGWQSRIDEVLIGVIKRKAFR
jgi:uncharacterized protein (DUF4415 family)